MLDHGLSQNLKDLSWPTSQGEGNPSVFEVGNPSNGQFFEEKTT